MAYSSTSLLTLVTCCMVLGMVMLPLMVSSAPAPECPQELGAGMTWLNDDTNCTAFYVCNAGRRYSFNCEVGTVWSQDRKACVGKNSVLDKCSIAQELDDLTGGVDRSGQDACSSDGSAKLAKADNCAKYYNCDTKKDEECPFPHLYNTETQKCEHFSVVSCGTRNEPKDACDYDGNQCGSSHCPPCNVRFPTCRGLPDGLNPWVGREYSPYYVVCNKERAVYDGLCDNSSGPQIFHPEKRMCVEFKPQTQ